LALAAKIAVPAVLAVAGVAGVLLAPSHAATTASTVWIDAPLGGSNLTIGEQTIYAHATSKTGVTELRLVVDGTTIGTDSQLSLNGLLAYATMSWQATPGWHTVEVSDPDHGASAVPVKVHVGPYPVVAAGSPTLRPTITPSKSSASTSAAPSTSPPASSSHSAPRTSSSATPTHSSPPPHTSTPVTPPPAVSAASLSRSVIYPFFPGGDVSTVTATVTNATSVSATFLGKSYVLHHVSGNTWTVDINCDSITPVQEGHVIVTAHAVGKPSATRDAGDLSVQNYKP